MIKFISKKEFPIYLLAGLIFGLLPLAHWTYFFFGSGGKINLPWREFIVFFLPVFYFLWRRREFRLHGVGLTVAYLIPLAWLTLYSVFTIQSLLIVAVGLLYYLSLLSFYVFFRSSSDRTLIIFQGVLVWVLILLSLGMLLDFALGNMISGSLVSAGIDLHGRASTIANRTSFLFAESTPAATCLGLYMLVVAFSWELRGNVSRLHTVLVFLALALATVAIMVTFSRVGLIAIVASWGFIGTRQIKYLPSVFLFSIVSVVLLFAFCSWEQRQFFQQRWNSLVGNESVLVEGTDDYRRHKWSLGFRDMPGNFFLGAGIGSGNTRVKSLGMRVNHYESTPLLVINESGIVGLLLFFLPLSSTFYSIFNARVSSFLKFRLLVLLTACFAMLFVNPCGSAFEVVAGLSFMAAIAHRAFVADHGVRRA